MYNIGKHVLFFMLIRSCNVFGVIYADSMQYSILSIIICVNANIVISVQLVVEMYIPLIYV